MRSLAAGNLHFNNIEDTLLVVFQFHAYIPPSFVKSIVIAVVLFYELVLFGNGGSQLSLPTWLHCYFDHGLLKFFCHCRILSQISSPPVT